MPFIGCGKVRVAKRPEAPGTTSPSQRRHVENANTRAGLNLGKWVSSTQERPSFSTQIGSVHEMAGHACQEASPVLVLSGYVAWHLKAEEHVPVQPHDPACGR